LTARRGVQDVDGLVEQKQLPHVIDGGDVFTIDERNICAVLANRILFVELIDVLRAYWRGNVREDRGFGVSAEHLQTKHALYNDGAAARPAGCAITRLVDVPVRTWESYFFSRFQNPNADGRPEYGQSTPKPAPAMPKYWPKRTCRCRSRASTEYGCAERCSTPGGERLSGPSVYLSANF
jgi:hypothetical protein